MIVITATMKAKDGEAENLAKVIKEYAPRFLKDAGTIMYEVSRRADNTNIFFFYEKYENDKALTYHSSAPHFKDMFTTLKPYLDGRVEILMLNEI